MISPVPRVSQTILAYLAPLALAFICITAPVAAQFTAAVIPPKPVPRVDTTARQDSIQHAKAVLADRMADMKAWVDSAATALAQAPQPASVESAGVATTTPVKHEPVTQTSTGEVEKTTAGDTVFHNGARAPATATILPLLAVVGAGALLFGMALIRR